MLTYIFLSSLSFDDHAFWALSEITSIGPEIITFLGGFRHNCISHLVITFLGGFIHNFISHLVITFLGGLRPGVNGFTVIQLSNKLIQVLLIRAWRVLGEQKSLN